MFATHLSREKIAEFTPDDRHVAITIRDSRCKRHELQGGWVDVLELQFDDCTPEDKLRDDKLFSDEEADLLAAFIEKHRERSFVVACEGGISRSAAICTYIHEAHGHVLVSPPGHPFHPNPHVQRIMGRRLWMRHRNFKIDYELRKNQDMKPLYREAFGEQKEEPEQEEGDEEA